MKSALAFVLLGVLGAWALIYSIPDLAVALHPPSENGQRVLDLLDRKDEWEQFVPGSTALCHKPTGLLIRASDGCRVATVESKSTSAYYDNYFTYADLVRFYRAARPRIEAARQAELDRLLTPRR